MSRLILILLAFASFRAFAASYERQSGSGATALGIFIP
jgi:hypothetical protein